MKRFSLPLFMVAALASVAHGDTTIVNETFDQYTGDPEFITVWVPRDGSGNNPAAVTDAGILTTDNTAFPGIQGQAVDHVGGAINQYEPAMGGPFPGNAVIPTATQHLFVSVDFFDGASGNERMTLGLRNRTTVQNIIELGLYNSNSCDPFVTGCGATDSPQNSTPTTPGFYTGTGYATRTQLVNGFNAPLVTAPDWQYFQLPIELDRPDPGNPGPTDMDTIVSIGDIGPGWHRYTATIAPDSVTFTIDLFRDGFRNNMRDENGVVVGAGEAGVADATMTFPVNFYTVGFDSLRIGGPSGLSSAGTGVNGFDNILLKLIDVVTPTINADFNGNLEIDAADYVVWRDNNPTASGATRSTGDSDGDGDVDDTDYANWKATFGNAAPPASGSGLAAAAVPEPSTLMLVLGGMAVWALGWPRG